MSRAHTSPPGACAAWGQEGLASTGCRVASAGQGGLQPPPPTPLDKEDLCLHPSPRYDFIFLFDKDKNHHHKSQEKGIFAPHPQTVQKVAAVLGQSKSFLHGEGWGRGHSAPGHHSGPGSLSSGGGHPHPVERWAVRTPLSAGKNEGEFFHQTSEDPGPA